MSAVHSVTALDVLAAREDLRAARFRALDAALAEVRTHEDDFLTAAERADLAAAAATVASLRRTW